MTVTARFYNDNAPQTTTARAVATGDSSFPVASLVGYPTSFPYTATLDIGTSMAEQVLVTSVSGSTVTVTRNYNGEGLFPHQFGATFNATAVAQDYAEANAHHVAPSGVHGVTGNLVGTSDTQTLTSKTLTSPTINTPTVTGGTYASPALTTPTVTGGTFTTPTVNGGTLSDATLTGDATHPAAVGKATTAGGKTLSLQNSSGVEQVFADDAGNLTANTSLHSPLVTAGEVVATAGSPGAKTLSLKNSSSTETMSVTDVGDVAAGTMNLVGSSGKLTLKANAGPTDVAFAAGPTGTVNASIDSSGNIFTAGTVSLHGIVQPVLQSGSVTVTYSGTSAASGSVTFPATFNGSPVVVMSGQNGAGWGLVPILVTATPTGFSWILGTSTGATITGTAHLEWIAAGT
jgi:hypothetical protein